MVSIIILNNYYYYTYSCDVVINFINYDHIRACLHDGLSLLHTTAVVHFHIILKISRRKTPLVR